MSFRISYDHLVRFNLCSLSSFVQLITGKAQAGAPIFTSPRRSNSSTCQPFARWKPMRRPYGMRYDEIQCDKAQSPFQACPCAACAAQISVMIGFSQHRKIQKTGWSRFMDSWRVHGDTGEPHLDGTCRDQRSRHGTTESMFQLAGPFFRQWVYFMRCQRCRHCFHW